MTLLEQFQAVPCTYPLANRFAVAATPKLCGKPGGVLCLVPYTDGIHGIKQEIQNLCLAHACEVAIWNCNYRRQLTPVPFTQEEFEEMVAAGVDRALLAAELKAVGLLTDV